LLAAENTPDLSHINIYERLSLDKDVSVEEIQQQLHDLKVGWSGKAARQGSLGEQARENLSLIAAAEPIFANEDTREQYDLQLRRDPVPQVEESKIDWVSRAWNYYFVRDSGAARVAARKAREDDSKDVMAWVVSAWVELLGGDDELRTAKNYADEAFVLDDQGNDTTDVYGVRGTVFYLHKDFDRALQTFDRALASASPSEKPELLWRKALVFDAQREYQLAYDTALLGLTVGVDVDSDTEVKLENTLFLNGILVSANAKDDARISNIEAKRNEVSNAALQPEAKARLVQRFDAFLATAKKIASSTAELKRQLAVKEGGYVPDFPLKSLGIAILNVFLLPVWGAGGAVIFIPILFILGFGGFFAYQMVQRSEAKNANSAYEAAQKSAERLRAQLVRLEEEIPLREHINFEFELIRS
jgi:tetratricopeptide (TPR) repeat protein